MNTTWIIQHKVFRGDWETLAKLEGSRKAALKRFEHMVDADRHKVRAVSEKQAQNDYEAGRADNYKRKLEAETSSDPIYPQDFKVMYPDLVNERDEYSAFQAAKSCSASEELRRITRAYTPLTAKELRKMDEDAEYEAIAN